MEKTITKKIKGVSIDFIVSTAPANNAVHVHVQVHPNSKDKFEGLQGNRGILEKIATAEAKAKNRAAHLMFTQVNMVTEWQGQFNFD